ncbi:MAG: LysM domain-containing protein [Bacteroidota bacterium]
MATIKVTEGQNIVDIALQFYGSVDALVQLAQDNNLSVSSTLVPGQEIFINEAEIDNFQLVDFFGKNGIIVTTGEDLVVSGDFNDDFNDDFS